MLKNKDKHRQLMFNILSDIFNSDISTQLAFKGGTLCYFVYWLDRFSTDLDFDVFEDSFEEENFSSEIRKILNSYGTIKRYDEKRHTYFFLFSYGVEEMNIKLEFNKRVWQNNQYEIINFYGTDIKVMEKSSIFANKLVAVTDRKQIAGRDVYDIWFFFKNLFAINEEVIEERTGKSLKEYLEYLLDFIEKKITVNQVLSGVGEVLDNKQKHFVKEKLLPELKGILQMKINLE